MNSNLPSPNFRGWGSVKCMNSNPLSSNFGGGGRSTVLTQICEVPIWGGVKCMNLYRAMGRGGGQ